MNRKLFVFDMNGTLTTPNNAILDETFKALRTAQNKGHALAMATGRPLTFVQKNVKTITFDYLICANGAYYYEQKSGQIYAEAFVPLAIVNEMLAMAKKDNLALFISTIGETICAISNKNNSELKTSVQSLWGKIKITTFNELFNNLDKNRVTQSTILAAPEQIAQLKQVFMKNKDKVEIRIADRKYLDASPKNVSKYTAIQKILPQLNIRNKNVVAFGDSDNDIEMLRGVGHGIAMGNGTNNAKSAANEIIGSNLVPSIANKILELIKE